MRHVRFAALIAACAIGCSGCGWSPYGGGHATASGSGAVAPACRPAQLHVSLGPFISPATGQNPRALRIRNSGRPCVLTGYPTLHFIDRRGHAIPFEISHHGDQMVTDAPPAPVRLARGGSAWVVMNRYRCDLGDRRMVRRTVFGVFGTHQGLWLVVPRQAAWAYCGPGDPGSTVAVSPFEPRLAASLSHK